MKTETLTHQLARGRLNMITDLLAHKLAQALCKMPVITKQQEDIKFTALEDYFEHYKRFNTPLSSDVIDDSGSITWTSRIERKQALNAKQ